MLLFIALFSASPSLSDEQRMWCAHHGLAVVAAGDRLGIPPSRFVRQKAEVEAVVLEGDFERAMQMTEDWIARESGAPDSDPHPGWGSMLAWETDAPADFTKACITAIAG